MKITTFDPMIITSNSENAIKVFEALGFERSHAPVSEVDGKEVASVRMKNADGYHVDIVKSEKNERDQTIIRMNVDDFEEAYNIMTARGYKNTRGDKTVDIKSAKAATMVSPSGFRIALVKHIKNHD